MVIQSPNLLLSNLRPSRSLPLGRLGSLHDLPIPSPLLSLYDDGLLKVKRQINSSSSLKRVPSLIFSTEIILNKSFLLSSMEDKQRSHQAMTLLHSKGTRPKQEGLNAVTCPADAPQPPVFVNSRTLGMKGALGPGVTRILIFCGILFFS